MTPATVNRLWLTIVLVACGSWLTGCGESDEAKTRRWQEEQKFLADLEVQKEAEKERAVQRARLQVDLEAVEQVEKKLGEYADRQARLEDEANRKAVANLQWGTRRAIFSDTVVLQIHNIGEVTADFKLICQKADKRAEKTLLVKIAPGDTYELGTLEGWPDGFEYGDWCTTYVGPAWMGSHRRERAETATAASNGVAVQRPTRWQLTADRAVLYTEQTTSSRPIGEFVNGRVVDVKEIADEWLRIEQPDPGYLRKELFKRVEDNTP